MDHRYHINLFWSDEDGCWLAAVPDLPGCSTHGETPEEAIAEVQTAIEAYVDTLQESGNPVPEPTYKPDLL